MEEGADKIFKWRDGIIDSYSPLNEATGTIRRPVFLKGEYNSQGEALLRHPLPV